MLKLLKFKCTVESQLSENRLLGDLIIQTH